MSDNGGLLVHITALKSSVVDDKDTENVSDQHPPSVRPDAEKERERERSERDFRMATRPPPLL
jgi:hypothetical protein